jgi:succinate dehydrogenase/fumarate reductase flavoprotein subunit
MAIITEDVMNGTSRNTGSDKQTYYKLTLSGEDSDSVREMARTLFNGGCVDGDLALCEAALSTQCFFRLAECGVPFPRNRYGEYIGYKTDHDPRRRAASVGPYTSKLMTESLEREVRRNGIRVFNHMQAVKLLAENGKARGVVCYDSEKGEFTAFCCKSIILCTGGPAGMYLDSAYPPGHHGSSGIAFEAGARGQNLTEWQYGLASVNPRWNVSGTYMQSLPKFISTRSDGSCPQEFLNGFFEDPHDLLSKVFLKGYQWPFDVRKIEGGSSIIDILVYLETRKGRRVFLDFRENPLGMEPDYSSLATEAHEYLLKAGACFGKPIDRLAHMNAPAADFYKEKGIDLQYQPLEIALCAQHNNGGLKVDLWWQTSVEGLFAAGEAVGSHGVYRPGGAALNAGQVGAFRAASCICAKRKGWPEPCENLIEAGVEEAMELAEAVESGGDNLERLLREATQRMSLTGGPIRSLESLRNAASEVKAELAGFARFARAPRERLGAAFALRDALVSQYVYLSAMADYIESGGASRGGALYVDHSGRKPHDGLPDEFRYKLGGSGLIQEAAFIDGECSFFWRQPRTIPEDDDFFENVWKGFRECGNVF